MATTPRQSGPLPTTKITTLRNEVIKADPNYTVEANNVVEYEFGPNKKRIFKGNYKTRGPYADD